MGGTSTKELYEQIKSAKGLYEEPVIDSNYTVLEGNRRVACLRRLKKEAHESKLPGIEKDTFDIIKCKMIPKGISDIDKELFLSTLHVKGKLDWPTFNKAKKIFDLHETHKLTYDQLKKHLGMGKATMIQMVNAYEQTLKYGQKYPDEKAWWRKYSYFNQLFSSKNLKKFSNLQDNIDKFARWVHENKFKDFTDVRNLGKILEDEDATRILGNYNFEKAFEIIQQKNPNLKSREFRQIQKAIEVIRAFSRKELIKTITDPHRRTMIRELKDEIDSLVRDIDTLEKKEE